MVLRSKAQVWDEEKKKWVSVPTRKSDILSPLKKGIEQIGEKVGEKIEEVRERNRAIREVRRKIRQKELEEKALPIAEKYGISIEEAVLYMQSEERRKKAQEARKRLTEQLSEMSKNLSTATALQQPTTKKKNGSSRQRQEEVFFEEEPFIEEESLFSPEPQRRSFPSYPPPSYSRVGTPTYRRRSQPQRFDRRQRIDSMVNQIVIGRKRSPLTTSTKSTKKKIDEMLKKLI